MTRHQPRAGTQFAAAMNALDQPDASQKSDAGPPSADELDAAADRMDARGDRIGKRAAAHLRTQANGARFADALDDADAFRSTTSAAEAEFLAALTPTDQED